jgi:translocation and assembly module TamB
MSKRFRRLLLVFGVLVMLVVVSVGVISTPWAQRYLERRLISAAEAATGTRIDVREFHFHPLTLQFVLRGLVVHGKEPAATQPLFTAKTVTVELSPSALIEQKLLLRSVVWDEAEVHLYVSSDGTTNLPEPPAAVGFSIGRLTLGRTGFSWNEQRLDLSLSAQDLAILAQRQSSGKYSGSLSSQAVRFRTAFLTLPPAAVTARFELAASGLDLPLIAWRCAGMQGESSLGLSNWASPEVRLSFRAGGDMKGLFQHFKIPQLQGGKLETQGTVTYVKQTFSAQGRIQAHQLEIQTPRAKLDGITLATDFSAGSRRIQFSRISGIALGGTFQGAGDIFLDRPGIRFLLRSKAQGLAVQRVLDILTQGHKTPGGWGFASHARGTIEASWKGGLEDFRSRFDLELEPQPSNDAAIYPLGGSLRGVARLAPKLILDLQKADLRTPGSSISGQGTVGVSQARLALQISTRNWEEWRPLVQSLAGSKEPVPLRIGSEARFRGSISGPIESPEIRGHLESGPFEYRGWKWDSLVTDISAAPARLEIPSARVQNKGSTLYLSGNIPLKQWRLDRASPLRFSVRANQTPVEGIVSALGSDVPLAGSVNAQLDLQGNFQDVFGGGILEIRNGTLVGEPFDLISTRLRVTHSTWHLDGLRGTKGEGIVQGQAEIHPPTKAIRASLEGSHFNLGDFRRLVPGRARESPPAIQGMVSFDLEARGRTDNLTLDATANVRDIIVGTTPVGKIEAWINSRNQQIKMEGKTEGPGGVVRFSAVGPSMGDRPLKVTGDYSSLRIDPWMQLFSARKARPQLSASGTFQGQIPLSKLDQSEIRMQARELEIKYPNLTWKNAEPVGIEYARRRLSLNRFRLLGPATDLAVEGSILFGQGGALALSVEGNAEATLLSLIDPGLQANGRSTLKLHVTGNFERPSLNGAIRVQNVSIGYGDLPFRFTGLAGEISLEGDRATLRSLRGSSGGGTVTLGGFVTFGNIPRFNVQAELAQVRLRYPADFTSLIDGTLRLSGTTERGQITGDLTARQIFPSQNFNWLAQIGEMGNTTTLRGPAIASPFAPRIRLDVRLGSGPAVRFEAPDRTLRLAVDIDLRLQGTLANPVQVGTIQILSGEAVFRGNRYTIRRGEISMTNPFRTQPILGLEAQTRIQRYDLTVTVTGPFDRLKIAYRSDPPLPTEDIVTLLAFGYARQQQAMATGTTHPVTTVGATALLSEALSTQVSGRIQRLFGVSRIKIDPNVGGIGTAGGARITVEQQLTPELTLTYVTNTSSSQQRIIQLEWAVTDKIAVLGARDQNGIFAMELRFRQRFK